MFICVWMLAILMLRNLGSLINDRDRLLVVVWVRLLIIFVLCMC